MRWKCSYPWPGNHAETCAIWAGYLRAHRDPTPFNTAGPRELASWARTVRRRDAAPGRQPRGGVGRRGRHGDERPAAAAAARARGAPAQRGRHHALGHGQLLRGAADGQQAGARAWAWARQRRRAPSGVTGAAQALPPAARAMRSGAGRIFNTASQAARTTMQCPPCVRRGLSARRCPAEQPACARPSCPAHADSVQHGGAAAGRRRRRRAKERAPQERGRGLRVSRAESGGGAPRARPAPLGSRGAGRRGGALRRARCGLCKEDAAAKAPGGRRFWNVCTGRAPVACSRPRHGAPTRSARLRAAPLRLCSRGRRAPDLLGPCRSRRGGGADCGAGVRRQLPRGRHGRERLARDGRHGRAGGRLAVQGLRALRALRRARGHLPPPRPPVTRAFRSGSGARLGS
jgi:hypothetical protein